MGCVVLKTFRFKIQQNPLLSIKLKPKYNTKIHNEVRILEQTENDGHL